MRYKKIVIFLLLSMLAFSLNAAGFRVLDLNYTMQTDVPWVKIITNQQDWEIFYNELLTSNGYDLWTKCAEEHKVLPPVCSYPKPPKVNFNKKQIVIVGVGIRYNNVGRLVVSGVDARWRQEKITVNLLDMDPECYLPHSVSYPMVSIVVPKQRDKEVKVIIEEATTAVCDFS
jgi:hypothetical protein